MSQINPFNINGNYPVAGQDNDSQGFRDNFTNTRNNLNIAKTELEDLQSKVILKRPLIGQLDTDTDYNNLGGAVLTAPSLKSWRSVKSNPTGSSIDLDFSDGNAFIIDVALSNNNITLSQSNFPNDSFSSVRIWFNAEVPFVINLPVGIEGAVDIQGYNAVDNSVEIDVAGSYVFEISTHNNVTFYINDLSRARNSFTTASIGSMITLVPLGDAPANPSAGSLAMADGLITGWDPASAGGSTPYPVYYNGAEWVSLI
jgi:hypothetical protein